MADGQPQGLSMAVVATGHEEPAHAGNEEQVGAYCVFVTVGQAVVGTGFVMDIIWAFALQV